MFELTKDLLDKIGRAIMPDAELVPVGPHFEASCAADIKQFFRDKELQEPLIEGWIDSTKNRLSGCYFNFLTEAGLLTTDGKRHIITPPLLDISLERYLEVKGETAMIKALTGVN